MTQHIFVISIKKIKISATCFGPLSHHQAKTVWLLCFFIQVDGLSLTS